MHIFNEGNYLIRCRLSGTILTTRRNLRAKSFMKKKKKVPSGIHVREHYQPLQPSWDLFPFKKRDV